MSVLLAVLLVGLSVALALRLGSTWVLLGGMALLLGVGWGLGAQPAPWLPLLALGLVVAWGPRPRLGLAPSRATPPRPANGKNGKGPKARLNKTKTPTNPRTTLSGLTGAPAGLEDKYEILEKVGIGGMATVYKARDKSGQMLALKIPQEKFVGDTRFVRRFHREAEVLAHLDHPGIVKVFDHGNVGDTHYIAMEFLDGEGLDRLIESRKLSVRSSVEIMQRVAEALQHIHAQGIIHRDIKPGNIMVLKGAIREDGRVDPKGVRLMDFGIAAGKVLTRLTITGARIGTPVYMSPEQAKGQRIDHKSDIYSLGVVFYEALTGQPPFQGGYEAVIHQQIFQMPTPPRQQNPEIPQALSDLVYRMLDKDPEKRPSLDQVIAALKGNWEEDQGLQAEYYLALAVEAKKGTLRLVEPSGMLARMWSGVGSGRGQFPSPPLSLAVDPQGRFWITLFEYGGSGVRLVHRFSAGGELEFSMGPYGMKPGEFLYPASIAVSGNDLYVLDTETNTISHFDLEGNLLGRFGGAGPGRGTFDAPKGLVVGRHFLYVLDYGNRQVQRLSLEGQYLSRYAFRKSRETQELRVIAGMGLGIDDQLYVYDADAQKIRQVAQDGQITSSIPLQLLEGEDPNSIVEMMIRGDILYAARRGGTKIQRMRLSGEPLPPIDIYAPLRSLTVWVNYAKGKN